MYLPDFDYYSPETVGEACRLLSELGGQVKVFAGGSDLLPKMKHELIAPESLISLKNIADLKKIEYVPGKGVVIGATATLNDLVFSEVLNEKFLSVSHAASTMAANQIRHLGTVGGNIASSVPSADLPPILIVLNASVTISGKNGERELPLEEIFAGPGRTHLAADEIITAVTIPDQATTGSTYFKYALRKSGALAVVGVAASVEVEGNTLKNVRVALGAVAPTPIRAKKTEEFLIGKEITDELLAEAGEIAKEESKPISDMRASEEYRRHLVSVFTKRSLRKAIDNGHV